MGGGQSREADGQFWALLERIGRAPTNAELRDASMDAFAHAGFHGAYFVFPVVSDPRIARVLTNVGLPAEWETRYREQDILVDPLPRLGLSRRSAFAWTDDIDRKTLSQAEKGYMDRLSVHGMARGIAVPCFGPFAWTGLVGVTLPDASARFDASSRLKIELASRLSFERYSRFLEPFPERPVALSSRETEVLQLVAEGKSNGVIAQLLEIAPSSVDVYLKRIFAKLGVSDRTSASVRALALGLVVTGRYPGKRG
ncbi:Regulatory protein SdiA [Tsuneonella dongtanensis]|uniref:Regulatory protein SdiA n=1 Tax=Tsuneonella dongtanensis TaxID=692370 RepID=A0A1B2A9L6_9SPHN|nr:Regulatory protein SdiA [Tsuneonella dongtanensis]